MGELRAKWKFKRTQDLLLPDVESMELLAFAFRLVLPDVLALVLLVLFPLSLFVRRELFMVNMFDA